MHSVPLEKARRLAYTAQNGNVVAREDGEVMRLAVSALLDARLLADDPGSILVLTEGTDRYRHGVPGDTLEAASIRLLETIPSLRMIPE